MVHDPLKNSRRGFDNAVKAAQKLKGKAKVDALKKAALLLKGV